MRSSLSALAALALFATPALAQPQRASRTRTKKPAAAAPASEPAPAPAEPAAQPAPAAPAPAAPAAAQPVRAETAAAAPGVIRGEPALFAEGFLGGLFFFPRTETTSVPGYGDVSVKVEAPPLFRLGARLGAPFLRVDERATLEWLGTLGVGMTGDKTELMGMTISARSLSLELLPGLRARVGLLPGLSLTAEAGMGVQFTRTTLQQTFVGETVKGTTHGLLRLALGGQYAVDSRLRIYFEPVGLHALVGQGGAAAWSLNAGVGYAL